MNICKTAWKFILWILFFNHLNFNPFGNWDFCTLVVKHPLIHISNKKASIFCYLKQLEFFRSYFQRRVRDGFRESMSLSEGPQIQEQLKIAQQNLQMIRRQVWIQSLFDTGYYLSNQHILSPINPKRDDWFCQIYEDLHKLFWNSKLALLLFLNFDKKSVIVFWVNWWQNLLIWQSSTFI